MVEGGKKKKKKKNNLSCDVINYHWILVVNLREILSLCFYVRQFVSLPPWESAHLQLNAPKLLPYLTSGGLM